MAKAIFHFDELLPGKVSQRLDESERRYTVVVEESPRCPCHSKGVLNAGRHDDSRVKTSVPLETEAELQVKHRPSGLRCSESFGRFDRDTSLWKTLPDLFGTDSTLSSKAWTQAGTMVSGTF